MKRFLIFVAVILLGVTTVYAQRIAVLSDIHVSPGNENARQLVRAVEEINAQEFDAVVVDGDLTNEGADAELVFVKGLLDKITHPTYLVPGNHENNWSQSATKTFMDLWGNDRFVANIGDVCIVGINCGPYMKMGDGHVKQEDLHWLKQTLDAQEGRRIVSFNHYPVRKDDLDNYREYAALLEGYPVLIHVNGHYHQWGDYSIGDIPAVTVRALSLDNTYGYSILDITPDTVYVKEKIIGEASTDKYVIPAKVEHKRSFAAYDAPMVSPEGFDVTCVWTDSASIFTRLAFDADRVYFGNSLGQCRAVNKADGTLAWQIPVGASVFSRPMVLNGGRIAFPHATGIAIADAATGERICDFISSQGPYVADGIIVGDDIYIQGGYKRIEGRDATTGELIWRYDSIDNYCQAAPVCDGRDLVFGAWDTYLRCIDPDSGALKWKWSNGRTNNLFSPGNVSPMIAADKVIIVAPDRYMTAIDRHTGETLWRDNSHRYRESMGHNPDRSVVYAKTMDGELVAVDAKSDTFTELWICDMGLGYEHAPCVVAEVDGVIYAGSRRGILTAVSADTHRVLWQLALGSSEINGIDIDPTDGSVWVSLIEGKVYRIVNSE